MSKAEGENRDFEDLDLDGEDLSEPGPLAEINAFDEDQFVSADDDPLKAESPAKEDQKADLDRKPDLDEDETEEEAEEKGGFLAVLGKANPFTVMLGVALAAILTACTCLLLEWKIYDFDMSASDYRQRAE